MKRALVIQHRKFGDLAQTLPAVSALRLEHPDWEIWLLGSSNYLKYLEGVPLFDRIVAADFDYEAGSLAALERRAASIARELPNSGWELVANLSHSALAGRLTEMIPAKRKAGLLLLENGNRALGTPVDRYLFAAVSERRFNRIHLSDIYKWMVGCHLPTPPPILTGTQDSGNRVRELLREAGWDGKRPLVALQLGTARRERVWPIYLFARLGRLLAQDYGVQPVLIGSAQEGYLAEAYAQLAPGTAINLVGEVPMALLPSFFQVVGALVGPDTGPTHVAAMSGCKVVGLYFANSWVHETGPYGDDHIVIQAKLPCSPCFLRTICDDRPCAEMIRPEHVVAALALMGVLDERETGDSVISAPDGTLEVFRSVIDQSGRQRYRRLVPQEESREDLLCDALEMAATAVLAPRLAQEMGGQELVEPAPPVGARDELDEDLQALSGDLRAVVSFARAAADQAARIRDAVRTGRAGTMLQQLGKALESIDAEIARIGEGAALVKAYIREAQRLLAARDLESMAEESRLNYDTAARLAAHALQVLERVTHAVENEKEAAEV